MFTGIIEAMGQVAAMTPKGGDVTLLIKSDALDFSDVQLGDSIAVNGVCLTATALPGGAFEADVSGETLSLTSLKQIAVGSQVNLEVDIIARYLERLLLGDKAAEPNAEGISMAFLAENGFLKGG